MRQSVASGMKNSAARNGHSRLRSNRAARKGTARSASKDRPITGDGRAAQPTLPLDQRLRIRDDFFLRAGIDPRQFLQAFDEIPGLYYFIKDAQSRTMLNTREYAPR